MNVDPEDIQTILSHVHVGASTDPFLRNAVYALQDALARHFNAESKRAMAEAKEAVQLTLFDASEYEEKRA